MLFIFLLLANMIHSAEPQGVSFLKAGRQFVQKEDKELQKNVQVISFETYEPVERQRKVYQGYPILQLLETVYGDSLSKEYDTVVFYAIDGYRADVPRSDFNKKKALLAFAIQNQKNFELKESSGKTLSLAPYYLAWDHKDADDAKNFFRWPYQIVKIDLIESKTIQAALLKKTVHSSSLEGMNHFLRHCFSCHQFNGVGGQLGPPLNPILSAWKSEDLVPFLLDPKKIRPSSSMAGLPKDLPGRKKVAESIVLFLNSNSK